MLWQLLISGLTRIPTREYDIAEIFKVIKRRPKIEMSESNSPNCSSHIRQHITAVCVHARKHGPETISHKLSC
jgi:hypothetical protein